MMTCPHCRIDLTVPPATDGTVRSPYTRAIMVEVPRVYDGGLYYQCPDCGGRWHRWPEDHRLRAVAAPYVEGGR